MKNTMLALTMIALRFARPVSADPPPATDTRAKTSPTKTAGEIAVAAVPGKELRIDAAAFLKISRGAGQVQLKDDVTALKTRADGILGSQWNALWSMCAPVIEVAQKCSQKAFSASDQKAAGCLPTETVQACSDKLLKWCIHSNQHWGYCNANRPRMLQELDALEQQIHLIRPRVAAYADF
jgi:hypothetical protein